METIGDRIKHLRNQQTPKMTQEQLGSLLGISASAVGQWEIGQTKSLKPENLLGVVDVFNCDFRWLITGKTTYYSETNHVREPQKAGIVIMSEKRHKALTIIQKLNDESIDKALSYLEFIYSQQTSTPRISDTKPPVLHTNV